MIDIDMIIERHEQLDSDLRAALATMERSDKVKEIREAILENQKQCPHFSAIYNWTVADGKHCPYCGGIINENSKA